jgi:wobble nucleotide-excising tRNase
VIEKITKLEGIGMLHDSVPSDGLVLSNAVAIYAENGRGKSTFSLLLRSLTSNDCTMVQAKRALRQDGGPHAELLIDGAQHILNQGSWDQTFTGLHLLDDSFVESTVSVGSLIGVKHLERLLAYALGDEAPSTADDISAALDDCRNGVNYRLREFGADFELATLTRNDTGAAPRADFTLRLMGSEVPLVASQPTAPSFSTTLSPGDRRMLALALFFCALDGDRHLPGKTVVFDDPARGLDRRRKTRLAEAIMGLVGRAQLIVLSHDAEFIRMMRGRGFDQVLQLERSGVYCRFEDCDIDAILATDYTERFVEPDDFMSGGHPTF